MRDTYGNVHMIDNVKNKGIRFFFHFASTDPFLNVVLKHKARKHPWLLFSSTKTIFCYLTNIKQSLLTTVQLIVVIPVFINKDLRSINLQMMEENNQGRSS